jgi:hypothetical protein
MEEQVNILLKKKTSKCCDSNTKKLPAISDGQCLRMEDN